MPRLIPLLLVIFLFLLAPIRALADDPKASAKAEFDNDDAEIAAEGAQKGEYPDLSEALRSKQYVHRAILSTVIRETTPFGYNRLYINHLMGFSQVYQKGLNYAKYSTALQGLSVGYVIGGGHGLELGLELSAVSCVFAGYRYFYRPEKFSIWPFAGGGVGAEVPKLSFSDGPPEQQFYDGRRQMLFVTMGLLVPLVDIGLKAEVRFDFYGADRTVFTEGIGGDPVPVARD